MPISFSMIVLSSQLVIAVADQVPNFDIAKSCKLDVAATTGLTDNQPVKSKRRSSSSQANGPHSRPQTRHSVAAWRPLVTHQVTSVC